MSDAHCPGVTLVELLVVLVLLGLMAGVVGLTLGTARPVANADTTRAALDAARDSAIRSGHAVTIRVDGPTPGYATAYPDGRMVADPGLEIDVLTGAPSHAR